MLVSIFRLLVQVVLLKASFGFVSPLRRNSGYRSELTRRPLAKGEDKDPTRIFFDISIANEPIGRLVFQIPDPDMFPLHTENLIKLCTQERRSIDPRCGFVGCEFKFSPQFIEGRAQYRWAHVLPGRGRNAVGQAEERISDPDAMRRNTHSIYGGIYYGLSYESIPGNDEDAVLLTVPMAGPGRGSTTVSIVRVAESPQEWKERLLLNSAVLGWMEPSSMEVLQLMARQTRAPPVVTNSGVLTPDTDT